MSQSSSSFSPSRRGILRAGLIAGAGLLTQRVTSATQLSAPRLRFAHLTDMHVQPEKRGDEGYAMAIESLKRLDPAPQFIITGGDHVMDAFEHDRQRAKLQWDLYDRALHQNTKLPVYPVMGNHDVWGWGIPERVPESEAGYGKAMALDRLGLKRGFYSFDAGGWHFIVLDDICRDKKIYYGAIEGEQLEWLKADLSGAGGKPACVVTHIPILAACVFFDDDEHPQTRVSSILDYELHRDARPLLDLFQAHNVKLVISGHIHLLDRVEYRGMTFICDGAVCGSWWNGPRQQFPEGYGVFDLALDGSVEHQYLAFGWNARAERGRG